MNGSIVRRVLNLAGCVLAAGCVACGGSEPASDATSSDATPAEEHPSPSLPTSPPTGPPAGMVRGNADGVNLTVSPGGAQLAFNDLTSDETRAALAGQPVQLRCTNDAGAEVTSFEHEWPSDASNLTMMMQPQGLTTSCVVEAGGSAVVTIPLEPMGGR